MKRLFVDDLRPCPEGWYCARTYDDAILLMRAHQFDEMSLDHDLGACRDCTNAGKHVGDMKTPETTFLNTCTHAKTGYDLVKQMHGEGLWSRRKPRVHSMNPCGRRNMQAFIDRYWETPIWAQSISLES